jgi:hypothetical protein
VPAGLAVAVAATAAPGLEVLAGEHDEVVAREPAAAVAEQHACDLGNRDGLKVSAAIGVRARPERDGLVLSSAGVSRDPVLDQELGQSGSAVAAEILEAWVAGTGLPELADPAAAYRAVTAEDVLRVATDCLDPAGRVEGVVRGTGATRPPVAALQD